MNKFFTFFQFLRHFFYARNEHSLHSPFAYTFYTELVKSKTISPDIAAIETVRKELKQNNTFIRVTDLGAGSGINNSRNRTISSICRYSEKKPALARLIYRIIQKFQPKTIFDLGTSLGLTTLYEAKANPSAEVYTFEGCPDTAALAQENFKRLNARNITTIVGNIDTTLPEMIGKTDSLDFVFFDANHRYEPTLRYFQLCLQKAHEDSIFVFDDIYWSIEMKKAWSKIKQDPSVGMSMDLFYIGIIFFRKKQPVQHFTLK